MAQNIDQELMRLKMIEEEMDRQLKPLIIQSFQAFNLQENPENQHEDLFEKFKKKQKFYDIFDVVQVKEKFILVSEKNLISNLIQEDIERYNFLQENYSHYRQIRCDSNQRARAIGVALLETLINNRKLHILENFANQFKKEENYFQYDKEYETLREVWVQVLDDIQSQIAKGDREQDIVRKFIWSVNSNEKMLDFAIN